MFHLLTIPAVKKKLTWKTIWIIALPIQWLLVLWASRNPDWVERYYSNGLYQWVSKALRILLGWIPFSVGDVVYLALIFLAIRYLVLRFKEIRKKPLNFLGNIVMIISIVYFIFHFNWGLNYHRQSIDWRFGIGREYTKEQLVQLTHHLIEQSNAYQFKITQDTTKRVEIPYDKTEIYEKTIAGYEVFQKKYPDFAYPYPSLKTSLISLPLTYMGYGGYLNPFSNEAQVNGKIPLFRLPTISGHEVGHQVGYSAEDATNLIGFLVSAENPDPYFKYAAYNHALSYCLSDLNRKDKALFETMFKKVNFGVRANYQELRDFWDGYENPLEPVFKSIFNAFLKVNKQEEGIQSYNSVVGLLVNYHERYDF